MKQNTSVKEQNTQSGQSSVNEQQVAQRAYELWEAGGQPAGRDLEYWLQAESELRSASQTSRAMMNSAQSGSGRETSPVNTASAAGSQTNQTGKSEKSKNGGARATTPGNGSGRQPQTALAR